VDVQTLRQTLATANEQLVRASRQTEVRLQELNALLDVVQSEAEDAFVSTASTLRGVQAGARRLRAEVAGRGRLADPGDLRALEEDTLDRAAAAELESALVDGMDETFEDGVDDALDYEVTDGDDRALPADGRDEEKPRIRPRGRRHV